MTLREYVEQRNELQRRAEARSKELADRVWAELGVLNRHIERVMKEQVRLEQVEGEMRKCLDRVRYIVDNAHLGA